MQRRILAAAAIALAAAACEPGIAQNAAPPSVATAIFDPTTSQIPLPNDLAFQADFSTLPAAQAEFLGALARAGGFPSDQEVAITIDFTRNVNNADGTQTMKPVALDLTTLRPDTVVVIGKTASGQGPVAIDPIAAADYVQGADRGTLTLHNKGRQPWQPGQYMVLVRGGPNGVRTADGDPVYASQVFYLIAQGQDLTDPNNIGLIRAQTNSMDEALALARQLNQLIFLYQPVFAAADQVFPHQELAVVTTFKIAPAPTAVELDPGRGLVPLPIDLLRDPRPASSSCAACGKLTPLAACTLASGKLDASGNCSSSAAGGFAALDGFSTTGAILAPVSGLVKASTVNASTVFLYDLTNPAAPVQVAPSTLIYEPSEVTSSGLSPAVVLQPASATAADASSVLRTRPLKDNTNYAVVITDGVKDKTGAALGIGTAGRILLFDNPVNAGGKSQLQGLDDATTFGLEVMRQQLRPVLSALASGPGITKDHVTMAYTFKTQSFLGVAAKLAALPYTTPAATALPLTAGFASVDTTFQKYGVNPTKVPSGNLQGFLEVSFTTFDLLDPATGAFNPDPTQAQAKTIQALIAVPKVTGAAPAVLPLMIFRHGLGGGRADMITVADGFAAKGMVVAAIDAAKHGDRSYCTAGDKTTTLNGTSFNVCNDGSACTAILPVGAQGDQKPLGGCASGLFKRPVNSECGTLGGGCKWAGDGIPVVSSNFLITANFFRTRDTFRQDIIDQSQLVRAMVWNDPTHPPTPAGTHKVFDQLAAVGVIINPAQIYFAGQSLGAIQGALSVAANSRISKAVLNVGGGTAVDTFTTSPAFSASVGQLLAALGIAPGTSAYLQFLVVAKTILDPGDPINYVGHITGSTLPNLLADPTGATAQAAKKLLTQVAFCDQVVPNPWNLLYSSTAGVGPLPIPGVSNGFGGPGTFQLFYKGTAAPTQNDLLSCPAPGGFPIPDGARTHGFLTDWVSASATAKAQSDAANFVASDAAPLSLVVTP